MHSHTLQHVDQVLPALRQRAIPGWILSGKERDEADSSALLPQLPRQFERDAAAGAVARNDAGAVWMEFANLRREVPGQIFDRRHRRAATIKARRLQAEKRLIDAHVLRQRAVAEDVAIVAADGKYRIALPARLQRHDRALLSRRRLGDAEKLHDLALALPQVLAELGRQRTRGSRAPQLVTFGPDANVAAAQLPEEGGHAHRVVSSRSSDSIAGA